MASETNGSTCKHPESSTPILTVNIPGGLAINFLGIIAETCPFSISLFPTYLDSQIFPAEDKATNSLGPHSPGTCTPKSHAFPLENSVGTGTSGNVSDCPCKGELVPSRHSNSNIGVPKSLKLLKWPKHSKHLKPLKPPKPLKHPKPLNPPKPLKHIKSPKLKNYPAINTSKKCAKHKKR